MILPSILFLRFHNWPGSSLENVSIYKANRGYPALKVVTHHFVDNLINGLILKDHFTHYT